MLTESTMPRVSIRRYLDSYSNATRNPNNATSSPMRLSAAYGWDEQFHLHLVETSQNRFVSLDSGTSSRKVDVSEPPDLVEALLDLYNSRKIAKEEGDVIPEEHALQKAERVLRAVYRATPRPYSVYPMSDGDIAIDAHTPHGTKVVVMCDPDGSARCLVNIDGEFSQRNYDDPSIIPDRFIMEALERTRTVPTSYLHD